MSSIESFRACRSTAFDQKLLPLQHHSFTDGKGEYTFADYLLVSQKLLKALPFLASRNTNNLPTQILYYLENMNIETCRIPRSINVLKVDEATGTPTSLEIDFFSNRLVTQFQGETKEVKLSNALGIIRDLSEIFTLIKKNLEKEKTANTEGLSTIEDRFSTALSNTSHSFPATKMTIEGKDVIALYPSKQRAVLTTSRGQSSIPLETIQSCAHLFNREFAKEICPLLGLTTSDPKSLQIAITLAYIGRKTLGVVKAQREKIYSGVALHREIRSIIIHFMTPGFAFYDAPKA